VSAPGALPALSGAWIRASEQSGDRLSLELENLRRGGLVYAGTIVFTGVTGVEIDSDHPMSRPPANPRLKGTIVDAHGASGVTVIDTHSQPGPGQADSFRFTIRHAGIDVQLRASLTRTVRRLAGLYPRPGDLAE
jgi:hypothetical protein